MVGVYNGDIRVCYIALAKNSYNSLYGVPTLLNSGMDLVHFLTSLASDTAYGYRTVISSVKKIILKYYDKGKGDCDVDIPSPCLPRAMPKHSSECLNR